MKSINVVSRRYARARTRTRTRTRTSNKSMVSWGEAHGGKSEVIPFAPLDFKQASTLRGPSTLMTKEAKDKVSLIVHPGATFNEGFKIIVPSTSIGGKLPCVELDRYCELGHDVTIDLTWPPQLTKKEVKEGIRVHIHVLSSI